VVSTFFSPEQNEYLASFGVTANGFNPPVVEEESTDYYYAKEFDVKLAGFSSLPKIDDVIERNRAGKPWTPSQKIVGEAYNDVYEGMSAIKSVDLLYLDTQLSKHKMLLDDVRKDIQRTKFAVLLSKKWFSDLDTRDGAVVTDAEGHKFTFTIRDIQVPY
jgi:hypothetical protein